MRFVYWRLLHVSLHIFFGFFLAPCLLLFSFLFSSLCLLTPNTILFCLPASEAVNRLRPLFGGVYRIFLFIYFITRCRSKYLGSCIQFYIIYVSGSAACSNLLLTASPDVGNLSATWHCIMMRPAMLQNAFYSNSVQCPSIVPLYGLVGVAQIKF